MKERACIRLLQGVLNNRRVVCACLAVVVVLAAVVAIWCGVYSNDLSQMFPYGGHSARLYAVSQQSGLGGLIQLELDFGREQGANGQLENITALAQDIAALDGVKHVDYRADMPEAATISALTAALPQLYNASELKTLDAQKAVASFQTRMAMPGTPVALFREDPFGWRARILQRMADIGALSGASADVSRGFLCDVSGRFALLLIQTQFERAPGQRELAVLLAQLESAARRHVPNATALTVSPLKHNIENEQVVRRDILFVSVGSSLALILLFLFLYRRAFDAVWIAILPFVATVLATGLLALLFRSLCLVVLGICGGIAGLAVDQGIHVFTAYSGEARLRKLADIAPPLCLSVLSSAVVFLLLGTIGIRAYVQMGLFAALELVFNAALSYFFLPTVLRPRPDIAWQGVAFKPSRSMAWIVIVFWLAAMLIAGGSLRHLQMDFRVATLDGTSAATCAQEEALQARWSSANGAVMAVLLANDETRAFYIAALLNECYPDACAYTQLWPPEIIRRANLSSWQTPEARVAFQRLQQQTQESLRAAGLPPALFAPFFNAFATGIDHPVDEPALFKPLRRLLVQKTPDGQTRVVMFFPKDTDLETLIADTNFRDVQAAPLSAEAFALAVRQDVFPRVRRLAVIVGIALFLTLLCASRSPKHWCVILLPGVSAFVFGGGVAALCGYPLNLVNLFAAIMLTGLVLDYGFFALHASRQATGAATQTALVLSATTTLLTTGALLFSRHPVLFHTGVVLFTGILTAAVTALVVVPAWMNLNKTEGDAA